MSATWQLVGIDVSAKTFHLSLDHAGRQVRKQLPNTPAGHRRLLALLQRHGVATRVALEATGTYYLDLALALATAPDVEVMVVNPRSLRHYAQATGARAKTDPIDADLIVDFLRRMPFEPWRPPSRLQLDLLALSRRISQLVDQRAEERNRLHATRAAHCLPEAVRQDLRDHIAQLGKRIAQLRQQALELIHSDAGLQRRYELLLTVPGIATVSAITLLAEIDHLPDGLSARQWVASAGLDPRIAESGQRRARAHISRAGNAHLRRALYMPVLVATRRQAHFRAFYERLVERGKPKRVAQTAAMRKLLHALYGILKNDLPFDPRLLFPSAHFKQAATT